MLFLGLVGFLVFLVGFYIGPYKGQIRQTAKLKEQLQPLHDQMVEYEGMILRAPDPVGAIARINEETLRLEQMAPATMDIPRLIQQLASKSEELEIEVAFIRPRDDFENVKGAAPQGVYRIYVEVQLQTDYQSLGRYIEELGGLTLLCTIEDMTLETNKDIPAGLIQANLIVSSYVLTAGRSS